LCLEKVLIEDVVMVYNAGFPTTSATLLVGPNAHLVASGNMPLSMNFRGEKGRKTGPDDLSTESLSGNLPALPQPFKAKPNSTWKCKLKSSQRWVAGLMPSHFLPPSVLFCLLCLRLKSFSPSMLFFQDY